MKTKTHSRLSHRLVFKLFLFLLLNIPSVTNLIAQDFTEDFSDSNFIDSTRTTVNLSNQEQAIYLAWSNSRTHRLPDGNRSGLPVGSESDHTVAMAFADVDGDGDVDVLAGNCGETNKLYLNDGAGVFSTTGTAIGTETHSTWSVAFADVDADGDVDLVARMRVY